ncbi:MAG: polysaccharide deacetylase family protein, partial [Lacticaseibacillus rhamnosus]
MKHKYLLLGWGLALIAVLAVIICFSLKLYVDHQTNVAKSLSASRHYASVRISESKRSMFSKQAASRRQQEAARRQSSEQVQSNSGRTHIPAADPYAYPIAQVKQEMTAPNTSSIKEKVVFLTFDDGPNTIISPQVLDILNRESVHGT